MILERSREIATLRSTFNLAYLLLYTIWNFKAIRITTIIHSIYCPTVRITFETFLTFSLFCCQVSVSAEHQEFFVFLQRLLSPVLEAYSGAAIFVHSLSQPMAESEYTQRLFRYLLTRTERGVAAYGNAPISPHTA